MDKKIITISLGIFLVLVVGSGFMVYGFLQNREIPQNQETTEVTDTSENTPENTPVSEQMPTPGIEVIGEDPGLNVCSDQCGDGVCQDVQETCTNLNCICLENKNECPQDCK